MSARVVLAACFRALAAVGAHARADDPEPSALRDLGLRELERLTPVAAPVPEPAPVETAVDTPDPDPRPVSRLRQVVRWVRARLWR